ncbi:hypothetical protein PLICRDRAFT_175658 [Plicaturopsis crispa FD-325 SS-3]|nr:hypothetical protein PLICRDRAFT_175658 [Plicaturopsis crispa FD-325 SS-3]
MEIVVITPTAKFLIQSQNSDAIIDSQDLRLKIDNQCNGCSHGLSCFETKRHPRIKPSASFPLPTPLCPPSPHRSQASSFSLASSPNTAGTSPAAPTPPKMKIGDTFDAPNMAYLPPAIEEHMAACSHNTKPLSSPALRRNDAPRLQSPGRVLDMSY